MRGCVAHGRAGDGGNRRSVSRSCGRLRGVIGEHGTPLRAGAAAPALAAPWGAALVRCSSSLRSGRTGPAGGVGGGVGWGGGGVGGGGGGACGRELLLRCTCLHCIFEPEIVRCCRVTRAPPPATTTATTTHPHPHPHTHARTNARTHARRKCPHGPPPCSAHLRARV